MNQKSKPTTSSAKPAGKAASGTKGGSSATGTPKSKTDEQLNESLDFLAPAQRPDELGRLAHYRVLKILGRGGMGTVFLAEDPRLKRQIALKVMLPEMAKKQVACDRFKREAQATAKLEHDHIVTIYDVNEDNGIPYLAMQVLKGMSLDDWLKSGKVLNVPQILRIGKEVAKGLAAAHACKLVHRDIKPSNIWLDATNKGRVKILDFGLARPTNEDTSLTQEGMILGTPAYMSPEQARGNTVDERSDLFSLGCVLYRLCADQLPFLGKDPMAMLLAIINAQPTPVQELNLAVPTSLAVLIHQLLAKKPEDRPTSAQKVVQAIQAVEREWINNAKSAASPVKEVSVAPAVKDDVDPALEESAITDLESHHSVPSGAAPVRSGRKWIFAGLIGAVLAVMFVTCGLMGLAILKDEGTVTVVTKDGAASTLLKESGLTVVDNKKNPVVLKEGRQQLRSGEYHVQMRGLPRGMQVEPLTFRVERDTTLEVVMQYVTPVDAK